MPRASTLALALALCVGPGASAQPSEDPTANAAGDDISISSEEVAVKAAVSRFLTAIGNYDLAALPAMFTENANIGAVSFRDGRARSNNIDYFTLMKEGGVWRFLSASYVSTPITGAEAEEPPVGDARR